DFARGTEVHGKAHAPAALAFRRALVPAVTIDQHLQDAGFRAELQRDLDAQLIAWRGRIGTWFGERGGLQQLQPAQRRLGLPKERAGGLAGFFTSGRRRELWRRGAGRLALDWRRRTMGSGYGRRWIRAEKLEEAGA